MVLLVNNNHHTDDSLSSLEDAAVLFDSSLKKKTMTTSTTTTSRSGILYTKQATSATDTESDSDTLALDHSSRHSYKDTNSSSASSNRHVLASVALRCKLLLRPAASKTRGTMLPPTATAITSQQRPKKHVSFDPQESTVVIVDTLREGNDVEEYRKDLFYSRKELNKMLSQAQRLGQDVAWVKDKNVPKCILVAYGLSTSHDLTLDQALEYYFGYQAQEQKDGGLDTCRFTTTLRGLERYVTSEIVDQRCLAIQTVLSTQAKLRRKQAKQNHDHCHDHETVLPLARTSWNTTQKARHFARWLAKGDEQQALQYYQEAATETENHNNNELQ